MGRTVLILLFFLISALGFAFFFDFSKPVLENKEEAIFKAIQRDEYLRPYFTYESSIANLARKKQCVRANRGLHKGARQKSNAAFKWVIDVPVGAPASSRIKTGIAELDALVGVSLLEKDRVDVILDAKQRSFDRYRLTKAGWAELTGTNKGDVCFYLGRVRHLAIMGVQKIKVPVGSGKKESAYQADVLVGFPAGFKLPGWANNAEVRRAFPKIDKLVNGYEQKIYMVKNGTEWREYLSPRQLARMKKSGKDRSNNYFTQNPPQTKKETIAEVITGEGNRNDSSSCINLPGEKSNGARVDKKLGRGLDYGVVVYDNKERAHWDHVETRTKPYLDRLVDSGLLVARTQSGIKGEKKDAGKTFRGTVYSLAPGFRHIFDRKHGCIHLGKSTVEIIDLEISAGNTPGNPFANERVEFKYVVTFTDPPEWANDRVLQAWWPDLKGALEHGIACDGRFTIDLTKKRKLGTGMGSCWWAYDSFAEL